jgi:hypothetical protein
MYLSHSDQQAKAAAYERSGAMNASGIAPGYGSDQQTSSGLQCAIGINHKLVSELDSVMDHMEQKLSGVLRPVPPQPAGNEKLQGVSPVVSPAVDELNSLRRRLEGLISRVAGIADRFD